MFQGAFMGQFNILSTLRWSVPFMLAGVAAAIAVRAGVFNMGLEGCIALGGLGAALVGAFLPGVNPLLHVTLSLLAGGLIGMVWLLIPAWLCMYHRVNVVIMTWMFSYIAVLLCQFLAAEVFQRPEDIISAVQYVRTPEILETARLPQLVPPYQLNAGLFVVLGVCLLFFFFCTRTKEGYEHKMVGLSPTFAEYGGINIKRVRFWSLLVSGGVGGLVGAVEVLGIHHRYIQEFAVDMGPNGIMVSLMGRLNPIGVPLAGVFMGAVQNGARAMSRQLGVSLDTMRILIAVIIICITAEGIFELLRIRKKAREGD
jgi:simple sugar transport system permease protein